MSDYFGPDLGRHYDADDRQFSNVVHTPGGPPVAEEFVLGYSIQEEKRQQILQNNVPSGWITNPSDPKEDFQFDRKANNLFWIGKDGSQEGDVPYALVNGWMVPIAGTNNANDLRNRIQLPPPQGSSTVNFVFLEVWEARISPGNDTNKPASDKVYKYGNVDFGGTNLDDDMLDHRFQKETSERTQIQYRFRVIDDVDPASHPYGFHDSIKAQGPLSSPLSTSNTSYAYTNMGETLNDPGLWRAGIAHQLSSDRSEVTTQSDLKTVDGYVYAVPVAFVFRRSTSTWSIVDHEGAYQRDNQASDPSDAQVLPDVQLSSDLSRSNTSTFSVDTSASSTVFRQGGLIRINDEIIKYDDYSGTTFTIDNRGAKDTHVAEHKQGDRVDHVSGHPNDYFSDQIVEDDIQDLRHATSFGDWDFQSLLDENFQRLISGDLKTQWKKSRGDMTGLEHFQVDYFTQGSLSSGTSSHVERRDGPDGIRKVFSDACVPQQNNVMVFDPDVSQQTVVTAGSAVYDLNPSNIEYFRNLSSGSNWHKNDTIRIPLSEYRQTFDVTNDNKVRMIHPYEYQNESYHPFEIWWASTYKDNSTSGLTLKVNGTGSPPKFRVLGKKPSNLASSYLTGTNDLTFNHSPNPSEIDVASIDFSDTPASIGGSTEVGTYLANNDAWIVIRKSGQADRNGAFQIEGQNSGNLQVNEYDASTDPTFGSGTESSVDWYIRQEQTTATDDEVIIALGEGLSGQPTDEFDDTNLFLSYDLLYHPSRGMSRCPDEMKESRLDQSSANDYLRTDTFPNKQASSQTSVKRFPTAPMESYAYSRGSNTHPDPSNPNQSIESVWAESYVDRGSKTFLFQPIRRVNTQLYAQDLNTSVSYSSTASNVGFKASSSDQIVNVPGNGLTKTGRVDLPFVNEQTTSTPDPPWGYNHILNYNTQDNTNYTLNNYLFVYDHDGNLSYNSVVNLSNVDSGPNEDALTTRFYDNRGIRGLELSQHFGISRLYGVYEKSDFYNNHIGGSGEFTSGSNYRQKSGQSNLTNLLREDSERRPLYITENDSFVVTEDVIDTSSLSNSLDNTSFVIEASIFCFRSWSGDFIQLHETSGSTVSNGDEQTLELLMNAPADSTSHVYSISTRTPYQGNIGGTMPESTTNSSNTSYQDYNFKQEADDRGDYNNYSNALDIDQARVENPVRGEILVSKPFATCLGTGRISGPLRPGRYTDAGYLLGQAPADLPNKHISRTKALEYTAESNGISDRMSGLSERLPLGLFASDHQFLGEGFFDNQMKFWTDVDTQQEGRAIYRDDELESGGSLDDAIVFSDGTSGGSSGSISYDPSNDLYRTYRGGTAMRSDGMPIVLTGERVYKAYPYLRDFITEYMDALTQNNSFDPGNVDKQSIIDKHEQRLQIHGTVLFGVALLVRTQKEDATTNNITVNHGQEIQMYILTGTAFGSDQSFDLLADDQNREFKHLDIQLHPTGAGEKFCAADRYRINGRPLRIPSREDREDQGVDVFRFRD